METLILMIRTEKKLLLVDSAAGRRDSRWHHAEEHQAPGRMKPSPLDKRLQYSLLDRFPARYPPPDMSQPFVSTHLSGINHFHPGTITLHQLPNVDPAHAQSSATPELGFQPIHLLKFALLLIAFLAIPLLSTTKAFPRPLGNSSRKPSGKNSHRRRRLNCCQLPASYQPPQSVVDAPFVPLPTRRHFRISHVGNLTRLPAGTVVYTNQSSSSDSDGYSSEDAHHPEPPLQFRLVFGKRLRGEEVEFKGLSAMKGSRLAARSSHQPSRSSSSSSLSSATPEHSVALPGHHCQASPADSDTIPQQSRSMSQKKAISFAATTQACTYRISTQIDSGLSFLSCQLK
ncbi:uncharacterized protein VP01_742g5 [Puccinia sorghi]|uniref:Uncharacterized protein n=1 Tax=Puccinia sorghi TaxID=27349 RepID=A0A0L6UCG3_9BASI|nr:uncharacterized protein VP01_742g5 [Puccinia sorghi]